MACMRSVSSSERFATSGKVACVLLVPLALAATARAQAPPSLTILPSKVELRGPLARQRIVVEEQLGKHLVGEVTDNVSFGSTDPSVVRVEDGVLVPVSDGSARVVALHDGRAAAIDVTVRDQDRPFAWSFRNHVQSVLAKASCNSGSCHGAIAGQNGFRLSLRGYDTLGDFFHITRDAGGRRIVPSDPGRSLLLLKPTGVVPHKGGVRFETTSLEYRVLAEWIGRGAPAPRDDEPRIERIELIPPHVVLRPGASQQLLVRAWFDDGRSEDVTRWAKYTATNASVAHVDEGGRVSARGHGEGAITAWYQSLLVVTRIASPFDHDVAPEVYAQSPRRSFIDEIVLRKLESLRIEPSPRATDAVFVRRAFVDTIGVLPSADEVRAFLADPSKDKRDRLIDDLLDRPEFVDYWAYKWSDLLLVNGKRLPPAAMWSYYSWIRDNVEAGTPWDEFARRIVTARGSTLENGAANFFVLHRDPPAMAETTSITFLGTSITCARCHNHPLEKWTNDQYYAMANLFARVRTKSATGAGNVVVFDATEGDLLQPLTGKPRAPSPLDGEPLPLDSNADRRAHLAGWLTHPDNPYFARAIVNRIWANFLGVGLVESVDDLRMSNPASNEELLSALARHLVDERFDLESLMRTILRSETYQRSSQVLASNRADDRLYSRYYPRRIMAEVLLDALSRASGVPTEFPGYPRGWRATQLPDSNIASYFLKSFGRPNREVNCACERTDEPSMAQVLHMVNGDTINEKIAAEDGRITALLAAGIDDVRIIEEAFLGALARFPTDDERRRIAAELSRVPREERREAIEDLFWSLLTSREFLFHR